MHTPMQLRLMCSIIEALNMSSKIRHRKMLMNEYQIHVMVSFKSDIEWRKIEIKVCSSSHYPCTIEGIPCGFFRCQKENLHHSLTGSTEHENQGKIESYLNQIHLYSNHVRDVAVAQCDAIRHLSCTYCTMHT